MSTIAPSPIDLLDYLRGAVAGQGAAVLVTLVGIDGVSSRRLGSQMVVRADGDWLGSFSAGCAEAAVVAEAGDVLKAGLGRQVRFGKDSPYIDIRLPCGSGIDLMFTPVHETAAVDAALAALRARRPAVLETAPAGLFESAGAEGGFVVHYTPALRLILLGQGDEVFATARLAECFGAEVELVTPRPELVARCGSLAGRIHPWPVLTAPPAVTADPWTAVVSLFHERDWEDAILPNLLGGEAFYIGAIGSRRTQDDRRTRFAAMGCPSHHLSRLRGPIGAIPSTRDPASLALSILTEVVASYHALSASR